MTSTKLYVPIVTLSTKDNVNLTKQLKEGFKRPVYWNKYKSKIERKEANNDNVTRFFLDASFQEVSKLFAFAFDDTTDDDNRVQKNNYKTISSQE